MTGEIQLYDDIYVYTLPTGDEDFITAFNPDNRYEIIAINFSYTSTAALPIYILFYYQISTNFFIYKFPAVVNTVSCYIKPKGMIVDTDKSLYIRVLSDGVPTNQTMILTLKLISDRTLVSIDQKLPNDCSLINWLSGECIHGNI
jgi:hypothetical protein